MFLETGDGVLIRAEGRYLRGMLKGKIDTKRAGAELLSLHTEYRP
jgi:hypothetical protein